MMHDSSPADLGVLLESYLSGIPLEKIDCTFEIVRCHNEKKRKET